MGRADFRRIGKDHIGAERDRRPALIPVMIQQLLDAVHHIQFQPVAAHKIPHQVIFRGECADDAGRIGVEGRKQPQMIPALCQVHHQFPGFRCRIFGHPEGKGIAELQMGADELQEGRRCRILQRLPGLPGQLLHSRRRQLCGQHLLRDPVAALHQVFFR